MGVLHFKNLETSQTFGDNPVDTRSLSETIGDSQETLRRPVADTRRQPETPQASWRQLGHTSETTEAGRRHSESAQRHSGDNHETLGACQRHLRDIEGSLRTLRYNLRHSEPVGDTSETSETGWSRSETPCDTRSRFSEWA